MQRADLRLKVAYLYPDLLNIYGDQGNILAFKNRCAWRDIDVEIVQIKRGDKIWASKYDFYFIGGGQDTQQIMASFELQRNREELLKAAKTCSPMLAVCGGYQLFGHYYQPHKGERLDGIGIFDAYTTAAEKRFIGNVSAENDFLPLKTIVGFENHSGLTFLNKHTKPFVKVKKGAGNNGKDKTEGARFMNAFGTYLHGPLLPKNPHFCDYLISLALKRRYNCEIPLLKLDDDIELYAHNDRVNAKY